MHSSTEWPNFWTVNFGPIWPNHRYPRARASVQMLAKPSVLAKSSMAVTLDGNIPGWMSSLQWIHKSQVWPSNRAECMTTNVLMFLQWLVSTNVSLRTRASRMTQPSHPSQVLVAVLQSLKLSVHSAQSCRVKVPQGSGIGSWRCTLSLPIYMCVCAYLYQLTITTSFWSTETASSVLLSYLAIRMPFRFCKIL